MDDARRFLRFIGPGALFGVETAILLWVLRPDWLGAKLDDLRREEGLSFALAGLLASGALGFLFSVVHHELHWRSSKWSSVIDHSGVIRGLIQEGRMRVDVLDEDGHETVLSADLVTRSSAWKILSGIWFGSLDEPPVKAADAKVSSLSDLAHSSGTTCVASFFSLIFSLAVAANIGGFSLHIWPIVRFICACSIGVLLTCLFWWTYRRVGLLAQAVIEQVFLESLDRRDRAAGPMTLRVSASAMLANPRRRPRPE
ncbi:MAG: hypothetical protein ABSC23_03395 [Bryobacteraceae bacterium]|jgi:hypothetical protein